ncbi:unnamed protein product [Anisakis simplex]|uniref:HEPN domain-containing protein n=1 Tax=Anisakis simplex TaxID=6269 RepID=A0A0M3KDD7_ANISI|nr:unnamed protein product [Anisakis simplex]
MYSNFESCRYVEQIYYENWIKVTDLRSYLARLRRDNFSVQNAKVAALAGLNLICVSAPFDKQHRFPEHVNYIIDSVEPYLSNLLKIRQFLELGRGAVASDMGMTQDLQKAFQESIKILIDALNKSVNFIDRKKLELNLKWNE